MMEKSSSVILSEEEKVLIKRGDKLIKSASEEPTVPERFQGWYSHSELEEIANESN